MIITGLGGPLEPMSLTKVHKYQPVMILKLFQNYL